MVCAALRDMGRRISYVRRRRTSITSSGGCDSAVQGDAIVGIPYDVGAHGRRKQPEVMFAIGPEGAVHTHVPLRDSIRHVDPGARQLLWQDATTPLPAAVLAQVGEPVD